MEMTDEQWKFIEPLIPKRLKRDDGKGRPPQDDRSIFEGILWILRTGARWSDLPERFPPYQTCHRRFQEWNRTHVIERLLEALAEDLLRRRWLDLEEAYKRPRTRPNGRVSRINSRIGLSDLLLNPSQNFLRRGDLSWLRHL
jgi:transposase